AHDEPFPWQIFIRRHADAQRSFVPIFDVGSSSKARSKARITKVSQTNIDDLLIGFFWRAVKFA
ncbi:hypothetical protein, partial [Mesorhizobium sp. M7A.F.Ca.CA.004.04.2.1]|uniref:hypothetical protein n=1 Tax=Mesorhizobium sp. M7A.F.Ca.CA.004.04.2.1 TaxID=2496677 RepID=UPI0019D4146E